MNKDSLAKFLVNAPLYRSTIMDPRPITRILTNDPSSAYIVLPVTIKRECITCGALMSWDTQDTDWNRRATVRKLNAIDYNCRNCGAGFSVWFAWAEHQKDVALEKYGQYPKFEVDPPKHLEKALGAYVKFWRQGMTMRHHGYGIGALVYFRRIVEGMTQTLLRMLAEAMEASNESKEKVKEIGDLIEAKRPFDEKMDLASTMIPQHLRPGGANPFHTIFEIVSGGMHGDTDEECCDLVDALSEAMALLFAKLNTHIEEQKSFAEAVKKIETLRNKT